jgi:CubicO group peptidase (beta-lactamase class C family)
MAGALIASCVGDGAAAGVPDAPRLPWWSVTKTALAACALALTAHGRLELDAPLPERAYTLRHLLAHTGGLGNNTARADYAAAVGRGDAPWTDDEILTRVRPDPFLFAPGQRWSYSNTDHFLLRRLMAERAVVEHAAGSAAQAATNPGRPAGLRTMDGSEP